MPASPIASSCRASLSAGQRSSASSSARNSPLAASRAALTAAAVPELACWMTRAPWARAISAEASVEPSSTTISSCGACVCASALASASARYASPL
jgi:hypothetical protein